MAREMTSQQSGNLSTPRQTECVLPDAQLKQAVAWIHIIHLSKSERSGLVIVVVDIVLSETFAVAGK